MFEFEVKWYSGEEITNRGLVAALNYREATEKLLEFFDEDDVLSFSLKFLTDSSVVCYNEKLTTSFEEFMDII